MGSILPSGMKLGRDLAAFRKCWEKEAALCWESLRLQQSLKFLITIEEEEEVDTKRVFSIRSKMRLMSFVLIPAEKRTSLFGSKRKRFI